MPIGKLVELSANHASACTTASVSLVIRAQQQGEPVLWVQHPRSGFFPPDLATAGVDLESLVVVRLSEIRACARAMELAMRSGTFGLGLLDLRIFFVASRNRSAASQRRPLQPAAMSRLSALARKHQARLVALTDRSAEQASLGPMVSLRLKVAHDRSPHAQGSSRVLFEVLKDKTGGSTGAGVGSLTGQGVA